MPMIKTLIFALTGLALFAVSFGSSLAIDPRFEIDMNKLIETPQTAVSEIREESVDKPVSARKAVRKKKKATSVKKRAGKRRTAAKKRNAGTKASKTSISLFAVVGTPPGNEIDLELLRGFWSSLVPGNHDSAGEGPAEVNGRNFLVTLDPVRFPGFPAADGARIVIDRDSSLREAVKVLIRNEEPMLRIVSESPANGKSFMRELLAAANFYSVEEDFTVAFGAEPALTVFADYKIERLPDSLMQNEVILLNVESKGSLLPGALKDFLARQGFRVVEAFKEPQASADRLTRTLYSITTPDSAGIVDAMLKALAQDYEVGRIIEIDGGAKSGISLSIRADRYFEAGGEKVAVLFHDDDTVGKTLSGLLATDGCTVVLVEPEDDFEVIAGKLLSRFTAVGNYGTHELWPPATDHFGLRLTGMWVASGNGEGGGHFLTSTPLSRFHRELLLAKGFMVVDSH